MKPSELLRSEAAQHAGTDYYTTLYAAGKEAELLEELEQAVRNDYAAIEDGAPIVEMEANQQSVEDVLAKLDALRGGGK